MNTDINKPKYFYNWTSKEFTTSYNSESWTFQAGEFMLMKSYLADFFARKLADMALQEAGFLTNDAQRQSYVEKCFQAPEGAVIPETQENVSSEKSETLILNAEVQRLAGKTKKIPAKKKEADDDSFAGLEDSEGENG